LATLAFAGLRVAELLALHWRDVDLAVGHLRVRVAKTEAGMPTVDIQPELRDLLVEWKMGSRHDAADELVFPTRRSRRARVPDCRRAARLARQRPPTHPGAVC